MEFHQKKTLCLLLIILLFILALFPALLLKKRQPAGEYITTQEVQVLTMLLKQVWQSYEAEDSLNLEEEQASANENALPKAEWKMVLEELEQLTSSWKEGSLTYGQFLEWKAVTGTEEALPADFDSSYQPSFFLLKKDWYAFFNGLCERIDPQGRIRREELLILGDHNRVKDIEGAPIQENQLFSQNGLWENNLPFAEELLQKKGEYITYENCLWGLIGFQDEGELENVWVVEAKGEELVYFYGNHEITSLPGNFPSVPGELVANLYFSQGRLDKVREKTERISGQVLKLSDSQIELKEHGTFELADSVQYYRLYDRLETVGRNTVKIGYDFADFVVENGKIQAGLLVKDEQMENIRVLIKTSNFDGYYHDQIEAVCDVDMELIYGSQSQLIPAGESLKLNADSEWFKEGRIYLRPTVLTGRTRFSTIQRSQQEQGYHGSFELEKRDEGILLINEVLLEEYLYAVVPSEMPAYYPIEALKAQAVCARTYAYDKMLNSSLGSYGAHLDDSSTFQVYNNIRENTSTTKAVKETRGLLLYHQEELAKTYYYSTSCGFGTDDAIWNREGRTQIPYLQAREMTEEKAQLAAEELTGEDTFRAYIDQGFSRHFEAREPWYRWTYEHHHIEQLLKNLRARQEKYPNDILISENGGNFETGTIPEQFSLTDIKVNKRGAGGTVEELLFIGDQTQILVRKELNVRAILTDGEARAVLQDGKTYACGNLLPSAFYYITMESAEGKATGIKLFGGGFGHGVGMSQNGAKNLADRGRSYDEILLFYYTDCQVHEPASRGA
ncbi:MAG: SpoIID/LytB domain-containing protein [Lachnospiraceae bacterium]|nr:SpoIID/LytB domain-containing protein [Lachnospiraceae bacterium]